MAASGNDSAAMTASVPGPLFVVACPACGGRCAVGAGMAGAAARCPLCAAGFRVPVPSAASVQSARTPESAAALPTPVARDAAISEPAPTFEVPDHVLAPNEPVQELQFREPTAKTIGFGATTIELRRLTPAAREARRRRRNVLLLLGGGAILIAITRAMIDDRRRRGAR